MNTVYGAMSLVTLSLSLVLLRISKNSIKYRTIGGTSPRSRHVGLECEIGRAGRELKRVI